MNGDDLPPGFATDMDWHRRRQLTTATFVSGLTLLLVLAGAAILFGFRTQAMNQRLAEIHGTQEEAHALLQAAVDAETGVRGFTITANPDYLQPYYSGLDRMQRLLPGAGSNPALAGARSPMGNSLSDLIRERQRLMAKVIDALRRGGLEGARAEIAPGSGKHVMDEIRDTLDQLNARLNEESGAISASAQSSAVLLSTLLFVSLVMAIALSAIQFVLFRREIVQRGAVEANLQDRHRQIALVSQLSDSLHSSNSRDESYEVIKAFAGDILAGTSGCLYVYNNSRDLLNRAAQWGFDCINPGLADHFPPDDCWGLRRGKINVMSSAEGHVHCRHVPAGAPMSYLCLPITGRGQTYGLLYLQSSSTGAERAFAGIMMRARSFADQLSLALVNIELRERLQNMAIKDPLTELYNRRFLDEALSRELLVAERKGSKLCIAMIDIDHFKKVNDTHGHPAGDAILKQVARYLAGTLRRSDIICRYGGEEMLLVMPECDIEEGVKKANAMREGIKALTLRHDGIELPPVTVSIGIAVSPEHGRDRVDLVACADQALYHAKNAGRDRVAVAETHEPLMIAAS
jgi:diguanylate cyclase (GGDEF)-like protein